MIIILVANGLYYASYRCDVIVQVGLHGWCVWKDVEWAVYTYLQCMLLCMIGYNVRSCVLYI